MHDHHYHHQFITSHEIPHELTQHNYGQPTEFQHFNIEMEYADYLSKLTSDHNNIRRYQHNVGENLGKKGLKVTKTKLKITSSADKSISGKSVSFSEHFSTPKKISKEEKCRQQVESRTTNSSRTTN